MILIGGRLIVLVAFDAAESRIIVVLDVTGGTGIPGTRMGARVNGEVLGVVLPEIGRFPARVGGVTRLAVGRKTRLYVVRVDRSLKVLLVAADAVGGDVRVVVANVTTGTVVDGMAFGQGKEVVVETIRDPGKGIHVMALRTIGGESDLGVIRLGRGLEVFLVAGDACRIDGVEAQHGGIDVASLAVGRGVGPQQRKTVLLVEVRHVSDNPRTRVVAAGTIHTYRLLVDVGVAAHTLLRSLREHQRAVAQLAIHRLVGPRQRKCRGVVAEGQRTKQRRPARRRMALRTVHGEGFPMGILSPQANSHKNGKDY